jgi:hypothetical protein
MNGSVYVKISLFSAKFLGVGLPGMNLEVSRMPRFDISRRPGVFGRQDLFLLNEHLVACAVRELRCTELQALPQEIEIYHHEVGEDDRSPRLVTVSLRATTTRYREEKRVQIAEKIRDYLLERYPQLDKRQLGVYFMPMVAGWAES